MISGDPEVPQRLEKRWLNGRKGVLWTHILMAGTEVFQKGELEILLRILRESLAADMRNQQVITLKC